MRKFYKSILAFLLVFMLIPATPSFADFSEDDIEEPPVLNPLVSLVTPTVVEISGGQTRVFDLTIRNSGSGSAQNFTAQANISEKAPFVVQFVNNSNVNAGIGTASSRRMQLEIRVDSDAIPGTYPVEIRYNYKNAFNDNFNRSDTLMVRVENSISGPNLTLQNFTANKSSLMPGDTFTLSSVIENNVTQDALDVRLLLDGLEANGVRLSNSAQSVFYRSLSYGAREAVSFDFVVSNNAKSGTYPIVFTLSYRDSRGEEYEKEVYYYVAVGSASVSTERGDLIISNILNPTKTSGVSEQFSVAFDLKNIGLHNAQNIRVSAILGDSGEIVPKSANVRTISRLNSGALEHITFDFSATNKAKTQSYTIGFLVEYETGNILDDGTRERDSFTQYVGVNISNPEKEDDASDPSKISIPKIIVSRYEVTPQIVSAGQEFDLDLTFLNTHTSKSIENIKAFLIMEERSTIPGTNEDRGNVFSPVNGSNTFFIDRINPRNETNQSLRLFVIPDATARTYTLTIKFEYQDADFNTYTEEALIGITVKQVTRLETSDVSIPTFAMPFEHVPISFQLFNMGRVTLGNLMVTIDAPGFDTTSTESTVYYGRFQSSEHNFYDGSIIAQESGQQPVRIIISFEDDSGEHHEVIREFVIDVAEPFTWPEGEEDFMRPGPGGENESAKGIFGFMRNIVFIIVGSGVTALLIVAISFIMFKKKKAKAVVFDE